LTYLSVVQTR